MTDKIPIGLANNMINPTTSCKKLYPTEGVNQIGWYVSTGDFWGITITEAESEEQLVKDTNVWRMAKPGLFKFIKTSPAMELAKALPILIKLKKQLEG